MVRCLVILLADVVIFMTDSICKKKFSRFGNWGFGMLF